MTFALFPSALNFESLDPYREALNMPGFGTAERRAWLIPAAAQGDRGGSKRLQSRIPPRCLPTAPAEAAAFEGLGSMGFPPANSPFMPQGKGETWQKH